MSGDSVTSRDTREWLVMPHAAVTNVEPATTTWGPTPRARHHWANVRPARPKAMARAMQAQISPSRRGSASAAQPHAVSHVIVDDGGTEA